MMFALRFSDGRYGELVSREAAERALDGVDPERRALVRLTCWEEVVEGTAETLRPGVPVDLRCASRYDGNRCLRGVGHDGRHNGNPQPGCLNWWTDNLADTPRSELVTLPDATSDRSGSETGRVGEEGERG